MMESNRIVNQWMMRVLGAAGVTLALIAALLLEWIMTAQAANPSPDDTDRGNTILCAQNVHTICPPDFPALLTRSAAFAVPDTRRAVPVRSTKVAAHERALTKS